MKATLPSTRPVIVLSSLSWCVMRPARGAGPCWLQNQSRRAGWRRRPGGRCRRARRAGGDVRDPMFRHQHCYRLLSHGCLPGLSRSGHAPGSSSLCQRQPEASEPPPADPCDLRGRRCPAACCIAQPRSPSSTRRRPAGARDEPSAAARNSSFVAWSMAALIAVAAAISVLVSKPQRARTRAHAHRVMTAHPVMVAARARRNREGSPTTDGRDGKRHRWAPGRPRTPAQAPPRSGQQEPGHPGHPYDRDRGCSARLASRRGLWVGQRGDRRRTSSNSSPSASISASTP